MGGLMRTTLLAGGPVGQTPLWIGAIPLVWLGWLLLVPNFLRVDSSECHVAEGLPFATPVLWLAAVGVVTWGRGSQASLTWRAALRVALVCIGSVLGGLSLVQGVAVVVRAVDRCVSPWTVWYPTYQIIEGLFLVVLCWVLNEVTYLAGVPTLARRAITGIAVSPGVVLGGAALFHPGFAVASIALLLIVVGLTGVAVRAWRRQERTSERPVGHGT